MRFAIPEEVLFKVHAAGGAGDRWLRGLDERIDHLRSKWRCEPGEVLSGGSESLVIGVSLESGDSAVVKLGLPGACDCNREAKVLTLGAQGPYVGLLDDDAEVNALLLERLGPQLSAFSLPAGGQLEMLCETLLRGWLPMATDTGLMTGAEKAIWLADFIEANWREVNPGVSGAVKERAITFAAARAAAFTEADSVLVHGDGHRHNALCALPPKTGLRLVDPDGLFAEPACDLAVPMRDWNESLLGGDAYVLGLARCRKIAALTGVDEAAIWQWGLMERVSTGLLMLQVGMERAGRETLTVAETWCAGSGP